MPKYLLKASYTAEGVKGVMNDGGTGRRAAVEHAVQGLGGTLDAFYFAFGEADVYVIVDLPDETAAVALSLTVNSGGAVQLKTVPLLTAEGVDEAAKASVDYRPPGG